MADHIEWAEKFTDQSLLQYARDGSSERISVIIELELPKRSLQFAPSERGDSATFRPKRIQPEDAQSQQISSDTIAAARSLIQQCTGTDPHWLKTARAFIIHATGMQISRIAESPLIKTIQPNRTLK